MPGAFTFSDDGDSDLGASREEGDFDLPVIPTVEFCLPSRGFPKPGKADKSPDIAAAIDLGG